MTGPAYPRVHPTPLDVWDTIISQYANSPILTKLITNFFEYVDPTVNFDAFFDLIWNVDTAQGYGLDVWGRIVGVSRTLTIPPDIFFGFEEASPTVDAFNSAAFFTGTSVTNNYQLADDAYRVLIFAKALTNISDGSIPSINQILLNLFPGRGNCYVTDGNDMTMTYTFEFTLTAVEQAILVQSGALPKPVGVAATIVEI